MDNLYFTSYFEKLHQKLQTISKEDLEKLAKYIYMAHERNSKIIIVGNGGSAAMASHVAVDLTKAAGTRAINFNEADLITCFSNDYGYDNWVAKAIEAYADPEDVAILISSSGQSANIIKGAHQAKKMGLHVITLSGFSSDNLLRQIGETNLWVDSSEYNIVEMTHHVWLLAVVDYIIERQCDKSA